MNRKDHKILRSCYLRADQLDRIKKISEVTHIPQAVIFREGLDIAIAKYEKLLAKGELYGD